MPHADVSLVPAQITSKTEFWVHVRDQLQNLLAGQRHWVTNLANASSLVYNALRDFHPHFGSGDRAVNWCALCTSNVPTSTRTKPAWPFQSNLPSDNVIAGFYLISSLFPKPRLVEAPPQRTMAPNEDALLLGPFCGKPACQFINISPGHTRGVCASAFLQQKTLLVPNVDEYPGHIACDGETKSEIVCPLILHDRNDQVVLGVLDLDCLVLGGFDAEDRLGLEAIAELIVKSCDW